MCIDIHVHVYMYICIFIRIPSGGLCTCHNSLVFAKRLICMYDMTHSYVWRDSFVHVTWLIRTGDMTHSYMWHDSFVCVYAPSAITQRQLHSACMIAHINHVTCNVRMHHVTHANESCHTCEWVMSQIRLSHATHSSALYDYIPHTKTGQIARTNESRTWSRPEQFSTNAWAYEGVISYIQVGHVAHTNESRTWSVLERFSKRAYAYWGVISYIQVRHDAHTNMSRPTYE